ncbi:hypothetical protein NEICINOT_05008 [Neisseria cinerea ATCC 14685]|uniref:Uncharacterized protein n=1 Tax=Neisseria cinerea ATCC 14685 TaxID=546262 RepID=D0W5N9_NEICI|nr:hypothetical protein NEICINOT_05008 [Neisseria cinerea ATCC 14685]
MLPKQTKRTFGLPIFPFPDTYPCRLKPNLFQTACGHQSY